MGQNGPKLCIIIKFHYNRLFERLNNVEKFRTAQKRNAKTKRTRYTAIHAMPHHSVGCYFIFPPLFVQLWERNGAVDPPNALAPVPVPAPAAIPIPSPSPNPPSQRKPT